MTTKKNITNDCTAVAFYGVSANEASLESFYLKLTAWLNSCGCPPDKLSAHAPGFSGKPAGFEKAHQRLCKQGFSDVKSLSLFAMLPDGKQPTVDWLATAYLDLSYKPCFVMAAMISIAAIGDDRFNRLAQNCLELLSPEYGIGYHREHDKGPGFYAIGLNYGTPFTSGPAYEEKLNISRWGDTGMKEKVFREGLLRDVYPYNYLTEPQLSRKVDKGTLKDWISSKLSHGTLLRLDERMMLWKVDSEQIKAIREELWEAGAIFDWKNYP